MMLRTFLILSFSFFASAALQAQQTCGTDRMHRDRMHDPSYRARFENANTATRNTQLRRQRALALASNTVYTIPVVFHVMHRGEPPGTGVNLSDEQIHAAIKELNERFRKIPGSIGDGNSVDMQIQFALAVRDPNGNCTNGINRVDMTGYQDYMEYGMASPGMDEAQVKALSFWDSHLYANVWIVSHAYGLGGFAYYAGAHGTTYDGVVATPGIILTPGYPGFTHEFGHYFNLLHTFEGADDVTCAAETDCVLEGDLVCDTPPQLMNAACEPTPNACVPGEDLSAVNYMSYSCMTEFTSGQKARALAAIPLRASLLEENGNMALVPVSPPSPDFTMIQQGVCAAIGSDLQLFDLTPCIPNTFINSWENSNVSFSWTMTNNNGTTLTSAEQNPVFNISAAGSYDVTLAVTTPQGTNAVTKTDFISATNELPQTPSCEARTSGAADYLSRTDDVGIREVIFSNMHHFSGTSVEDADNGVTNLNGYADFSCSETVELEPFTNYTISVVLSEFSDEHVHVYIDFDDNGIDDNDLVTSAHDITAGSGTYDLPVFQTPAFPNFNTRLRMRVIDAESSEPYPEACGILGYYGQIHDYSVIFSNLLPVANDDATTTNEDNNILIDVSANDDDPDGSLLPGTVDLDPVADFLQGVKTTAEGRWEYAPGNKVLFKPKLNFNGVATLQYVVSDNRYAVSPPATITVTVNPVNDAPSFTKGANQVVNEDAGAQVVAGWATSISAGPSNESSQQLIFNITNDNQSLFIAQPSVGALGELHYTADPNAFGSAIVTVVLKDDGGTTYGGIDAYAPQTFSITVNAVNDLPLANNDNGSADEDHSLTINVISNDTDTDGSIDVGSVDLDPSSAGIQNQVSHDGLWMVDASGLVTFAPALDFNGTTSIAYTVRDNEGATSNAATISIVINSINDVPVLANLLLTTDEDMVLFGNVLDVADRDPEGSALFVNTSPVNAPLHGSVTINADGTFTFAPAENYSGADFITVSICDADNGCSDKRIDFVIVPINDPPVITNYATVATRSILVSGNFSDGDNDIDGILSYLTTPVSGPDHGQIVINTDGSFTYVSDDGFEGTEVITIEVCDDGTPSWCVTKTLIIEVQAPEITDIEPGFTPVSVFPNPSSGEFTLSVPPSLRGSAVKVIDLFGRVIYQSAVEGEKLINLSQQSKGVYMVHVEGTNGAFVKRIVLR